MLIDSHVHIFPEIKGYGPRGTVRSGSYGRVVYGDGSVEYVLPVVSERFRYTAKMMIHNMDRYGVDRSVVLLDPCYGDWSDYVLEAIDRYPGRLQASAYLDPWSPGSHEYYESHLDGELWKNVKIEFSEGSGLAGVYPGVRLDSPEMEWFWNRMEQGRKTLSLDLGIPGSLSYQTEDVRRIALRHPDLTIVICHLGQPSYEADSDSALWGAWISQIELGRLPNVYFDCSAMPFHVQDHEDFPYPRTHDYFRIATERIGIEKVMWGTDVPWLLGTATYGQLVRHGQLLTWDYTEREKSLFFSENALRVYWHES